MKKIRINEKRNFVFTEKDCKDKCYDGAGIVYSDSACPYLRLVSGKDGDGSYGINYKNTFKVIGNIYRTPLDEARKITRNVIENYEEFSKNKLPRNTSLYKDFQENGYYPREKIEYENDNTKDLMEENSRLWAENKELREKLFAIQMIVSGDKPEGLSK